MLADVAQEILFHFKVLPTCYARMSMFFIVLYLDVSLKTRLAEELSTTFVANERMTFVDCSNMHFHVSGRK